MARDLHGTTALVTGAARRIGRAMALGLAREGVNVVVHYESSAAEATELVGMLRSLGVGAWSVAADLRDPGALGSLVDRAAGMAGPLGILVNNASAFPESTLDRVTRDDLDRSIHLDAWAPFELTRRFARQLDGAACAHVVNLLDTRVAAQFDWQHFAYCAAKDLLSTLTSLLAMHFAPRVAVNGIAPGLILPPEGKGQDYLEAKKLELPLRRIGHSDFITDAMLFLVKSEFITGQTLFVDGGRHLLGGSRG